MTENGFRFRLEDLPRESREYERFLNLFVPERDRLYGFIYSLVPKHADAEDIFQRCSLTLWRKINDFEPGSSFFAWACSVARNEVRNFIRSESRDRHCFSVELVEQMSGERAEQMRTGEPKLDALQACVQQLSESDRELMNAVSSGERRLADFAAAKGKALQSIYNRAAILRRKLADCINRRMNSGASGP